MLCYQDDRTGTGLHSLLAIRASKYPSQALSYGLALAFIWICRTILVVLAIVIMLIGRAKIQDLMAGVILHPIMAMTAGFLVAGAMGLAGGFDVLLILLSGLAEFEIGGFAILGYLGVAIILVNIPTIMPMPCGRILAAALVPGVYVYGEALVEITGNAIVLPVLLGAFIVNAAASCSPSITRPRNL